VHCSTNNSKYGCDHFTQLQGQGDWHYNVTVHVTVFRYITVCVLWHRIYCCILWIIICTLGICWMHIRLIEWHFNFRHRMSSVFFLLTYLPTVVIRQFLHMPRRLPRTPSWHHLPSMHILWVIVVKICTSSLRSVRSAPRSATACDSTRRSSTAAQLTGFRFISVTYLFSQQADQILAVW